MRAASLFAQEAEDLLDLDRCDFLDKDLENLGGSLGCDVCRSPSPSLLTEVFG